MRHASPDRIVDDIADKRGDKHNEREHVDAHRARCRQRACGKQERIARKERRDDKAGLSEDDGEEDGVGGGAVLLNQLTQMDICVKEKIDHVRASVTHRSAPMQQPQISQITGRR